MTRSMPTSIIASCLLIAACGGGSGAGTNAGDPDPTVDPTVEDDIDEATDPAPSQGDGGSGAATDPTPDPEDEPDEVPDDEPAIDPADSEAPSIISAWPEAGTNAVLTDEKIILEFSEPMDREATEAAYASDDLPSEAVTFSWSNADTVLTITPNAPLEYAAGFDPVALAARTYAYAVGTGAKDLAGNSLQADFELSFDTARMLLAAAPLVESGSGSVNVQSGAHQDTLRSGDWESGDTQRAYLTFALPDIPADPLQVLVLLESVQIGLAGEPYSDLVSGGLSLIVGSTSFSALEEIQALQLEVPIGNLSQAPELGARSLDVTNTVDDLLASDAAYAQFLVQFPKANDGDDTEDSVLLDHNSTRLAIAYLLP